MLFKGAGENIGKAEFYYTPFNILEIMGKIAKTEYDERIAYLGLSTISDEFKAIQPTVEGYLKVWNESSISLYTLKIIKQHRL